MDDKYRDFRSGYVALVGLPNVGKSTLLNQMLKYKISIISRRPQTTRKKVLGILTRDNYQIVFIDTPGLIEPGYALQERLVKYVERAIEDADAIVYLVEATEANPDIKVMRQNLAPVNKPVILAINKIDLIPHGQLLPLIAGYGEAYEFSAIVPISALKDEGVEELLDEIRKVLPHSPPYYPPDMISDQQERFFVAEIIREKIFQLYGEEIPYSTHVEINEFKERPGEKDFIHATIYVERSSHKGIIIGKGGRALKRVGEYARQEIEQFLGRPVFLELFVKVLENWRLKKSNLKMLGY
ncbi:MAG: GTPase Era [Calditrichia bacterium]